MDWKRDNVEIIGVNSRLENSLNAEVLNFRLKRLKTSLEELLINIYIKKVK